ncbi:MAG: polysaccharide biosynthesis/export family protein, partial [Thermodesulfobacteriota bacterium]
TYDTVKEVTFLQAIAMAGGLNDWASNNIVLITREIGKDIRRVINYKDVISGDALEHNVVLKSGDTIVVP